MAQQQRPVVIVELIEGDRQGVGLLTLECQLFGTLESSVLDQAMDVPAVHSLGTSMVGDHVMGGDNGVGAERLVVQPCPGSGDTHQRLLCEVLDQLRIADACRDHPPDDVGGIDQRILARCAQAEKGTPARSATRLHRRVMDQAASRFSP